MKNKLFLHWKVKQNNLFDKGSTKSTWTKLVASLFNGTPEGCMSAERFFISFGTSSQIFRIKYDSDSMPRRTLWTGRCTWFVLFNLKQSLTSFRGKPLTKIYIYFCRKDLYICLMHRNWISSSKEGALLCVMRKHLSCNLFISLLLRGYETSVIMCNI